MRATEQLTKPGRGPNKYSGKVYVDIHHKRGVKAFLNPLSCAHCHWLRHEKPCSSMPTLRSEVLTVRGQDYKLVSYRGGQWEVYRVTMSGPEKGLEMFCGYAPECLADLIKQKKEEGP